MVRHVRPLSRSATLRPGRRPLGAFAITFARRYSVAMPTVTAQERTLAAVGCAVGSTVPRSEVAAELIDNLHGVIGYDAINISLLDPFSDSHCRLVQRGYDDRILDYLDGEYTKRDAGFGQICAARAPLRMQDTAYDYKQTHSYINYWGQAGYHEGLTSALFSADDRYLGMVAISVEDERTMTEGVRDFVGLLAPVLAAAFDPLGDLASWLCQEVDAHRILVASDGSILECGGGCEQSSPASKTLSASISTVAQQLLAEGQPVRCGLIADQDGRLVHLHMIRVQSTRLSGEPVVLTSLRYGDITFGLTLRETEVLRYLVDGGSNREIAEVLHIAPRTVATHLEHLLEKFAASTRTAVVGRALEHGLVRLDIPLTR